MFQNSLKNFQNVSKGNTVHIRLIHAETSSPKGYKFMVGFEAEKLRIQHLPASLPTMVDYHEM